MTDTCLNFNLICSQTTKDKLREYLQRTGKRQNTFFSELLEEFLDSKVDSSFEGWYAYLVQEEGLSPEEAEKQAFNCHLGNCFVPQIEKANLSSNVDSSLDLPF